MLQSEPSSRVTLLAWGTLVVASLLVTLPLIGTLHNIEFQAGRNAGFSTTPTAGGPPAEANGWKLVTLIVRFFATAAAIVFLFELVFNRSFRCFFLSIAWFLGVIALVSDRLMPDQPPADGSSVTEAHALGQPTVEAGLGSQAENRSVSPSKTQGMLMAVALSVLTVSVFALGLHRWLRKKPA